MGLSTSKYIDCIKEIVPDINSESSYTEHTIFEFKNVENIVSLSNNHNIELTHGNGLSFNTNTSELLVSLRCIGIFKINTITLEYQIYTPLSFENTRTYPHSAEWIDDNKFSVFINNYKFLGGAYPFANQSAIYIYEDSEHTKTIVLPEDKSHDVTSGAYSLNKNGNLFLVTAHNDIYEIDLFGNVLFWSLQKYQTFKSSHIKQDSLNNMLLPLLDSRNINIITTGEGYSS
jgi:hypothetical protein